MQRRSITKAAIIGLTICGWFTTVVLYGYKYVLNGVAHPEARNRVPVDLESVAIERMPFVQLINFAIFRFPFLVAALILILLIESKAFSRKSKAGELGTMSKPV